MTLPPGLATTAEEEALILRLLTGSLPHWCAASWGVRALVELTDRGLIEMDHGAFVLTEQARARLDPGPQAAGGEAA